MIVKALKYAPSHGIWVILSQKTWPVCDFVLNLCAKLSIHSPKQEKMSGKVRNMRTCLNQTRQKMNLSIAWHFQPLILNLDSWLFSILRWTWHDSFRSHRLHGFLIRKLQTNTERVWNLKIFICCNDSLINGIKLLKE